MTDLVSRLIAGCAGRAGLVIALVLIGAGLSLWAAATRLSMNTDTAALFDADLPFRVAETAFDHQFPADLDLIVAVIDAPSKVQAQQAADRLAAALRARDDLFLSVRTPEGGTFFARNGLLYLSTAELDELSTKLAQAQPLLGAIATDRNARGLFRLLALAFEAARGGNTTAAGLAPAAAQAAGVIEGTLAGQPRPLNWSTLLADLSPAGQAPRGFVLFQPKLDLESLTQGEAGSAAIRAAGAQLGLTAANGYRLRLTGQVPLTDEEFATVAEGTGLSGVLATVLVAVLLYLALGSLRLVLVALAVLGVGLIYTLGWAALAVGELNLISVAFAVMFVGIAVDFSIQFLTRFRAERFGGANLAAGLWGTGQTMARPLVLAAIAVALGFFAFLPTDYRGVAQLGVIAGGGMLVAVMLTFTILPALVRVLDPPGEPDPVGYRWAAPLNAWLLAHRRRVLAATGVAVALSFAVMPRLTFDFDPIKLKDPQTESMSTVLELMDDPYATPNTLSVLVPDPEAARAVVTKLEAVPDVRQTISVLDLVPTDQDTKLAMIDDLGLLLGPALDPAADDVGPTPDEIFGAAADARSQAQRFLASGQTAPELAPLGAAAEKLVAALDKLLADRSASVLTVLSDSLVGNLDDALAPLRDALSAEPVTIESLPPDLRASWIARDGRYRVQIFPAGDARDIDTVTRFVHAVRAVAPDAIGPPVVIYETGRIVTRAFAIAAALATVTITLLLVMVLGRISDVLRTLAPLALAAVLTFGTCAAIGLSLNFANIIGLPLLLGVGVTFPIYLVAAWREGEGLLLAAPVSRAVVFSALTTAAAFGSLAISDHPGTAGLGVLLTLALGYTLVATLIVLPALLGPPPQPRLTGPAPAVPSASPSA